MNFETIQRNYQRGLWSRAMVRTAVKKGVISAGEYQKITGEKYE